MSEQPPPLASTRLAAAPKPISLLSPSTDSLDKQPPSSSSSLFGNAKSAISRKKPMGLDISKSIPKPSRSAPGLPGENGSTPTRGIGMGMTEHEKLREDIAKLQLSSRSSSTSGSVKDSPTSPSFPTQSDSSSSSVPKKGKTKKPKVDKEGLDLVKDEDLQILGDIGAGNGGTVTKVFNKKRKCIMARKLILVDAKPSVRKQILRELQIMSDCSSPYIVEYYGCFPVDVHVGLVIEYMDAGSLDQIYRRSGFVPIDIVGAVAEAVLKGLVYLYDVHRIIHRDVKPSNILANTKGEIKICDFGVSGELINSIANTFVGTSTYMSPERIQGAPYTIKSDVWSLGVSLIELALGRFPFSDSPDSASESDEELVDPDPTLPLSSKPPKLEGQKKKKKDKGVSLGGGGHTMSILELLHHIVNEPAPTLVSRSRDFPDSATSFIESCLNKEPNNRKSPQELLTSDWIVSSKVTVEDIQDWAKRTAAVEEE